MEPILIKHIVKQTTLQETRNRRMSLLRRQINLPNIYIRINYYGRNLELYKINHFRKTKSHP